MAEEKKNGFSAEGFLSSYPDASTPRTGKAKKPSEAPLRDAPDPPPKPKRESEEIKDFRKTFNVESVIEISKEENSYLNMFVVERVPPRFSKTGKQVAISSDFHTKIMKIITIFGKGEMTIGGYLDNVIRKHFEDLTPLIQSLLDKHNKF